MPNYAYDALTFLDNSFLLMEGPNNPMHVAGLANYGAGSLIRADGGVDIDTIRAYVESRLYMIPRYRQRLSTPALRSRPIWVDDPHFNIHYHVRHSALPKPGGEQQLKRLAARIMSQPLDHSKPLWEMWVIEGLEGGDRFAVVSKIHHCMVDGMSSVDLLNVLLQPDPTREIKPTPEWVPRPAPTVFDFATEAIGQLFSLPEKMGAGVEAIWESVQDPRSDLRARLRAVRDTFGGNMHLPSATPLNQPIGPHRRFDWMKMDLAAVKAVKKVLGGSLNDVVLATVSGAVRRYLMRHRVNVDVIDFTVMAPVSVRGIHERGTLGNRVSAWMVPLPLRESDPRAVLRAISQTTSHLKEAKSALGAEVLASVGEWTPPTLLSAASRMMTRALPFNLVVTNVPGPQIALYLLDAPMLDSYGMVPLIDYLCLGVVLFSYAGTLCWGFTCDWDRIPDLHDFVLDVEASFDDLRRAAGTLPAAEERPPSRPRVKKRAAAAEEDSAPSV